MRKSRNKRELIMQVHRATRALYAAQEALTDETAEQLGLNKTDHRCMDIIQRHMRLTPSQLAEATHLTTGAITTAIDRLERAGFVQRIPDPSDRRRVLIELSDEGKRRGWQVFEPIVASSVSFLDEFSEEELQVILDYLTRSAELQLAEAVATRRRGRAARPPADPVPTPD